MRASSGTEAMWFASMQAACVYARNLAQAQEDGQMTSGSVEVGVAPNSRLIGLVGVRCSEGWRHALFDFCAVPYYPPFITENIVEMLSLAILIGIDSSNKNIVQAFLQDIKELYADDEYLQTFTARTMRGHLNSVRPLGCFCPDGTDCSGDYTGGDEKRDGGRGTQFTERDYPELSYETVNESSEEEQESGQCGSSSLEGDSSDSSESSDGSPDESTDESIDGSLDGGSNDATDDSRGDTSNGSTDDSSDNSSDSSSDELTDAVSMTGSSGEHTVSDGSSE